MPKFYVAKGDADQTLARGSIGDLKEAIRSKEPGIEWNVEVYEFNFTKETICAFIEKAQEPTETMCLRLNDKGQVRAVS